jgi:hypothetical protein
MGEKMEQLEFKNEVSTRPVCYVRMSPVEFKRLQTMIKTTGTSAPELFRKALFHRMDLERPLFSPDQAKAFEIEIRRQGNNINQIAKSVNSGLMNGWSQSFNSLVRVYVDLRHKLVVNRANR